MLYSSSRGYDAVGDVISENTALGASSTTDNQVFCYDEQNRLVWAGATGTSPCNGAVSSGSLTSAYYSQAYSYDAQGRLTSGAIGAYTYGDASHPHAVTSIGGAAYTASYDAVGDMTCRAPNSSVTCSGTPTGATMSYDAERRLSGWQNTPSSPTVQTAYLYDGEGNRIESWVDTNGTQTTAGYLMGGLEERTNSGTITKYLGAKGLPTAIRVGTAGSLNYLATDGLGSVSVAVDGSGNVVASQLYGPYGASRYSSGTMPTSKGFTGQQADATTGLDYYGARYYDPAAGQFISADSVLDGLSRYAYVAGNPATLVDPSGHEFLEEEKDGGGGDFGVGLEDVAQAEADFSSETGLTTEQPLDGEGGAPPGAEEVDTTTNGGATTNEVVNAQGQDIGEMVDVNGQEEFESLSEENTPTLEGEADKNAEEDQLQERNAEEDTQQSNGTNDNGTSGAGTSGAGTSGSGNSNAACGQSFAPMTLVSTPQGKQQISSLVVGSQVVAYNAKTGKTTSERVEHVFIDHDTDLLDVTLRMTPTRGSPTTWHVSSQREQRSSSQPGSATSETVHTTASHPWLTADRGFVRAGTLRLGDQVV